MSGLSNVHPLQIFWLDYQLAKLYILILLYHLLSQWSLRIAWL